MESLEDKFTEGAPESLLDSITEVLYKEPLFLQGNTFSKQTLIDCNGIHPLTKKQFDLVKDCYPNLDKQNEVDSYLDKRLKCLIKEISIEPTLSSIINILNIIPLFVNRSTSACLNAKRLYLQEFGEISFYSKWMVEMEKDDKLINHINIWKSFIGLSNDEKNEKLKEKDSILSSSSIIQIKNNNNNNKFGIRNDQEKIKFILKKRLKELDTYQEHFECVITRDHTLKINSKDSSIKELVDEHIGELIKDWQCETLIREGVDPSISYLVDLRLSDRSSNDPNLMIDINIMKGFQGDFMLIKIFGIDIVPNYIQSIRDQVEKLISTSIKKKPTISSDQLYSLLKNQKDLVEDILNSTYSRLDGSMKDDYYLSSLNVEDWNQVNDKLLKLLNQKEFNQIKNNNQNNDKLTITFKKIYFSFINQNLRKKWNGENKNVIIIIYENGRIQIKGQGDLELTRDRLIKDIKNIEHKIFLIDHPFSISFYESTIMKMAINVDIKWKDNGILIPTTNPFTFLKNSRGDRNYGQKKSSPDINNNNKGIEFSIIGFNQESLNVMNSIIDLSTFKTEFKLDNNQSKFKIDYNSFSNSNNLISYDHLNHKILIQSISSHQLISTLNLIKSKLSDSHNFKIEMIMDQYEIDYLNKKKVLENLKKQYPKIQFENFAYKIIIQGEQWTVEEIKKIISEILEKVEIRDIDLSDRNDMRHNFMLLQNKVYSIQRKLDKKGDNGEVFINFKPLKEKDDKSIQNSNQLKKIDFSNITIFGKSNQVDQITKELIEFKSKIMHVTISPNNIKDIIDYLSDHKDKTKMDNITQLESIYNCSIYYNSSKTNITITVIDKNDSIQVENELISLLSKEPKDSKSINNIKPMILEKFFDLKWKNLSIEKNVVLKIDENESMISIIGITNRVISMYKVVMNEIDRLEKLYLTKEIKINRHQHDILFNLSNVKRMERECLVNIKLLETDHQLGMVQVGQDCKLFIKFGDLINQNVDVIVNPTNSDLEHTGGAALAIANAAGQKFIDDSRSWKLKNGQLQVGKSILFNNNYKIEKCKAIINSCGPNMVHQNQRDNRELLLDMTIKNSILEAEKAGYTSIAMPAISSGLFGYDINESAPVLIKAVINHLNDPTCKIKQVLFVDNKFHVLEKLLESIKFIVDNINSIKSKLNYKYKWEENDGSFIDYDEKINEILEKARLSNNGQNVDITTSKGVTYRIYFNGDQWYQVNTMIKNGNKRKVVRESINNTNDKKIIISNEKVSNYLIQIIGLNGSIENFQKELNSTVNSHLVVVTVNDKTLSKQDENEIICKAQFMGVEVKVVDKSTFILQGLNQNVQEIRIDILEKSTSSSNIKFPIGWDHKVKQGLINITENSKEWNHVVTKIHSSLPNAKISKISIVQNEEAYINYCHLYERQKLKRKDNFGEMELFHGTRTTDPNKICFSLDCFDFRQSNEMCLYGPGAYFAKDASYSTAYSFACPSGLKQFFMAKVLIGDFIDLPNPTKLRLPPLKSGSNFERYDSVKGITSGSEIYIVYDNKVSYPYYLITFS